MIRADHYLRVGVLMEQFRAHVLVDSARLLADVDHLLEPRLAVAGDSEPQAVGRSIVLRVERQEQPIPPIFWDDATSTLKKLEDECGKLALKASQYSIQLLLSYLADKERDAYSIRRESQQLASRLSDELHMTLCVAIEPSDKELVERSNLFGDEVAARFPKAMVDIEEAAKCLAFSRATACVFHLMRVLEVGLQALAADLGIGKVERNWQQLLQDVDAKIKALPFKTDEEKARLAQRSEAVAHLRNVKDAWRNDVMHPRGTYTLEHARDLFNHCRALLISLARFL